jgi:hypothetical protein
MHSVTSLSALDQYRLRCNKKKIMHGASANWNLTSQMKTTELKGFSGCSVTCLSRGYAAITFCNANLCLGKGSTEIVD